MCAAAARMILVGVFILSEWLLVISVGYILTIAGHIPQEMGFPTYARSIGILPIASSILVLGWLAEYRKPADILNSTYVTFLKLLKRARLQERAGRNEPLVVKGPYRYVRHPLYFSVILFACGLWLLFDWTPLLITTVLFLVWFNFVLTPFEEKELTAIFGSAYEEYCRNVPKILPIRAPRGRRS